MMTIIPDVLNAYGVSRIRALIDAASWVDGAVTAGHQSALVKRNNQLPEDSVEARQAGGMVMDALGKSALFIAAALPQRVYPPLFNRYGVGDGFGTHVDNAIRIQRGGEARLRSDLSATLFLSDPESYEGGELVIEGDFGASGGIKLPAGHMVLYPASSLHRVEPVTRGQRMASFFWIQSLVRDNEARRSLFELDCAIQALSAERGAGDPPLVQLTGVYHNLLRRWADT